MTARPVHVYRLDVTYPPGADPAQWPLPRAYLSRKGADHRAAILREHGATVTVARSLAVVWPTNAEEAS